MIAVAMMTFGKKRDGLHATFLQGRLKPTFIESSPDLGDLPTGVKIKVYLSESEGVLGRTVVHKMLLL